MILIAQDQLKLGWLRGMNDKGVGLPAVSSSDVLPQPKPRENYVKSPCAACAIRPLAICSGLSMDELCDLEAIVTSIQVNSGDPVFDEGEAATRFFIPTGGCIRIYKLLGDGRRQIVGFLFPGDFLGLAAEAVVKSHLCQFPRRDLEDLCRHHPALETRLLGATINELAIAQEHMVLLGRKNAREKLVTMFLMLSRRAQKRGEAGNPVFLPMTRDDLGDYLGLTVETVSRTITRLKSCGVIRLEESKLVRLLDMEKIEEMTQGF